jgi:hypothetical protein
VNETAAAARTPNSQRIAVTPVTGRVRLRTGDRDHGLEARGPRAGEPTRISARPAVAVAFGMATLVGMAVLDPATWLLIPAAGAVVWLIHRVDRRLTFSFGEGFLRFRADPGWPAGVQEDDDFRWTWSGVDHRAPRSGSSRVG